MYKIHDKEGSDNDNGLKNAKCIVWAIGECSFFHFMFFFILTKILL